MSRYEEVKSQLRKQPKTWLVTGVAGFIGSNLLETLLKLDQPVVGLDNFATGFQHNLDEVKTSVESSQWSRFRFVQGDIRNLEDCRNVCSQVDYVLHQAALGSVPRSLVDPITTNSANITGFLNMLVAARDANVKSFTYAASSSTYGDHRDLPKQEEKIGRPLSPYAVTKYVNELYADIFFKSYEFSTIGLRYFNVFGPRQNPNGDYAAVIPKWVMSMLNSENIFINGDGETSRDFCYIQNAVQANILAATVKSLDAINQVYNIAVGEQTSLNKLYFLIKENIFKKNESVKVVEPFYRDFRSGDVRHSLADIGKANRLIFYKPSHDIEKGLNDTIDWYCRRYDPSC